MNHLIFQPGLSLLVDNVFICVANSSYCSNFKVVEIGK